LCRLGGFWRGRRDGSAAVWTGRERAGVTTVGDISSTCRDALARSGASVVFGLREAR
jgi:hypothetical protein